MPANRSTALEFYLRLNSADFQAAMERAVGHFSRGLQGLENSAQQTSGRIRNALGRSFDLPSMTAGAAAMTRSLTDVAQEAIKLEASMANVAKVVDFPESEGLKNLENSLLEMSRSTPIAASGLAEIAAAGGQLGVAATEIPAFTDQVAKIATAFDLLPEKAGESMAKLSNVFNIPITQIEEFGNVINALSNNTAAKAPEIIDALQRVGGTSKQFGLLKEEAAALVNAMIALGKPPEVAATAINSMLSKMQTASEGTKDFKEALKGLGYNAEGLQKSIGQDAQGTLSKFLRKLSALDKQTRAIALTKLFGAEFQDDVGILVGSLGEYDKALSVVNDTSKVAGSIQEEFAKKSATTENQLKLLANKTDELKIRIGQGLIPVINAILGPLGDMATYLATLADESPEVAAALTAIGSALGGMLAYAGAVSVLRTIGMAVGGVGIAATGAATATVGLGAAMAGGLAVAAAAATIKIGMFAKEIWDAAEAETALEDSAKRATQAFQELANAPASEGLSASTLNMGEQLEQLLERTNETSAKVSGLTDQQIAKLQELIQAKKQVIETERERLELEENHPFLWMITDHKERLQELNQEEVFLLATLQDVIEEEKTRQAVVTESLTAQTTGVQAVSAAVDSLKEKTAVPINLKVPTEDATNNLNRVVEATDRLKEKIQAPAPVQVDTGEAKESINQVAEATDQLKQKVEIPADVQVDTTDAKQAVEDIVKPESKTVTIQADTAAVGETIGNINTTLEGLADKKILLTADSSDALDHIAKIKDSTESLSGQKIALKADASMALERVARIQEAMKSLGDKEISVDANVRSALSGIKDVKSALSRLKDKTITITTRHVEEHAGGGWAGLRLLARGGRLPGFGGGDRVPALLEAGEFVVRKERARLFSGLLNLMNYGPQAKIQRVLAKLPKFRTGGVVHDTVQAPILTMATGGQVVRLQTGGYAGLSAQNPIERIRQEVAVYRQAEDEKIRISEQTSDARLQIDQQALAQVIQSQQQEMDSDIRLNSVAAAAEVGTEAQTSADKTAIHQQEATDESLIAQQQADAQNQIKQQESQETILLNQQEADAELALEQQKTASKSQIAEQESSSKLSREQQESAAKIALENAESQAEIARENAVVAAEINRENASTSAEISRENAETAAEINRKNAASQEQIRREDTESQATIEREDTESQASIERENTETEATIEQEDAKSQASIERETAEAQAEIEQEEAKSQAKIEQENAESQATIERENTAQQAEIERENAEFQAETERKNVASQAEIELKEAELVAENKRKDVASQSAIKREEKEAAARLKIEQEKSQKLGEIRTKELQQDAKIAEQQGKILQNQDVIFSRSMRMRTKRVETFRKAINRLSSKTVTVSAKVSQALSNIAKVESALKRLKSKTVTVTVVTRRVERHAIGGWAGIHTLARGGRLPGFGGGDRVPAILEAGEFVVRKERARLFSGLLHLMNSGPLSRIQRALAELPRFHTGGIVNNLHMPDIPAVALAAGGPVQSGSVERFDIRLNGRPVSTNLDAPSQLRGLLDELKEGSRGLLP